jgi:hypothetical protein
MGRITQANEHMLPRESYPMFAKWRTSADVSHEQINILLDAKAQERTASV